VSPPAPKRGAVELTGATASAYRAWKDTNPAWKESIYALLQTAAQRDLGKAAKAPRAEAGFLEQRAKVTHAALLLLGGQVADPENDPRQTKMFDGDADDGERGLQ